MSYYFDTRKTLTDLKERDETNYLLGFINHAMKGFEKYGEKDIRHDYFELMHDLITNYSFNIKNFFLRAFIEYEEIRTIEYLDNITEEELKGEFDPILFRYKSLKTNLERSIVVEAWSMFEFAITTIFEQLFTEEEKSSRNDKYSKSFKTILNKNFKNVHPEQIELVVSELALKLDTFIPSMNKVNKIFKKYGAKYSEKENDIEFLQFYSRLRNGIHNNFIYKGPDKKNYEFKGNVYRFQDGKSIIENVQSQFDNIELVGELFFVIFRFFNSLRIDETILNPLPTMKELLNE